MAVTSNDIRPIPFQELAKRGEEGIEYIKAGIECGARIKSYSKTISFLIISHQSIEMYYIPPGATAKGLAAKYNAITMLFGLWALPWGPIKTMVSIMHNSGGGKDVTGEIAKAIGAKSLGSIARKKFIEKRVGGKKEKAIIDAETWLSHPNEYGNIPDECVVLCQKTMSLCDGDKVLTLIKYTYKESGVTGRVVVGDLVWSFIDEGLNEVPDDLYMIGYCGWNFVFKAIQSGKTQRIDIDDCAMVAGHSQARYIAKYEIGKNVIYVFTGINSGGKEAVGSTDGKTTVSFEKSDPTSRIPSEYMLYGAVLNRLV